MAEAKQLPSGRWRALVYDNTDNKGKRQNDFQELMDAKVSSITQEIIQSIANEDAKKHSPKTVRNNHGIISAVMKQERPDFALNTILPKKIRSNIYVPSDEEIQLLIQSVEGTVMELPVLLAAFGPMRRGEICALDSNHIKGNAVHVEYSMVLNSANEWVKIICQ